MGSPGRTRTASGMRALRCTGRCAASTCSCGARGSSATRSSRTWTRWSSPASRRSSRPRPGLRHCPEDSAARAPQELELPPRPVRRRRAWGRDTGRGVHRPMLLAVAAAALIGCERAPARAAAPGAAPTSTAPSFATSTAPSFATSTATPPATATSPDPSIAASSAPVAPPVRPPPLPGGTLIRSAFAVEVDQRFPLAPGGEVVVDPAARFEVELSARAPDARLVLVDVREDLVSATGTRELGEGTRLTLVPAAQLTPGSRYALRLDGAADRDLHDESGRAFGPVTLPILAAGNPPPPEPKKPARKKKRR